MKLKHNRGIRIQTRIIVSVILLLIQLAFLLVMLYNLSKNSAWAYVISSAIGIVTAIYILNRRGNPSYNVMWVLFILTLPIFGISVFLLWGGERVMPRLRKQMKICESHYEKHLPPDWEIREHLKYHDATHARQADYLATESGFPLYDNTKAEFLDSGEAFFNRLLKELNNAQKYIFIEFFIIAEGYMWDQIHRVLRNKAKQGVEVRVIFDDFGSIKRQHKDFISRLRNDGIKVSIFNPISPSMNVFVNNRNHRKIVIIDGVTAITGGINIGDEYINRLKRFGHWMDSAIIIKGNAVRSFLVMFCSMWEFTTGKPVQIEKYISVSHDKYDGFVLPYCDGPLNDKNPAEGIYIQILSNAQRYVYIATPYLIIDNSMINMLGMAAKSGIDVRIVTPHIPDKQYVHPVTQYSYQELLEAGIKIYEYTPGFIHSKLFVSDDKVATVGTVNMDYRSFVLHFECGVWVCDDKTVSDIKSHFNDLFSVSKEIKLSTWKKRPVRKKLKEALLHLFAPFM